MKKISIKSFASWKIGDYIRQFSIVTGGVLLTLWLTGKVTESTKQKEVRQAIQLVTLELRNNLQIMHSYGNRYEAEKLIALRLLENNFSIDGLPRDTIVAYRWKILADMGRPFVFSTDALEMFKSSGIAANMADKQQVVELLRCYKDLELFVSGTDLYVSQRRATLTSFLTDENTSIQGFLRNEDHVQVFKAAMQDNKIQRWLNMLPMMFNDKYFEHFESNLDEMISKLEAAYNL